MKYVPYLIIALLSVVVTITTLKRCNIKPPTNDTASKVDSGAYKGKTTFVSVPVPYPVKSEPVKYIPKDYIPSKSYDSLLKQFISIRDSFLTTKTYKGKVDRDSASVGYEFKVKENKAFDLGFEFTPEIRYKNTTLTITVPEKKRNQWYVNAGIGFNIDSILRPKFIIGGSIKSKRDRITTINGSINVDKQYSIDFIRSFKLHIK